MCVCVCMCVCVDYLHNISSNFIPTLTRLAFLLSKVKTLKSSNWRHFLFLFKNCIVLINLTTVFRRYQDWGQSVASDWMSRTMAAEEGFLFLTVCSRNGRPHNVLFC